MFYGYLKLSFVLLISIWLLLPLTLRAESTIDLLQQGQNAFERGQFSEAIISWEMAQNQMEQGSTLEKGEHAGSPLRETAQNQMAQSSTQYVDTLIRLGNAYRQMGHFQQAKKVFDNALNKGTPEQQALVHSYLGDISLVIGEQKKAATYFDKAVSQARSLNNPLILAHVFNNRGNLFYVQQNYPNALENYVEAANWVSEHKEANNLYIQILNNQAKTYLRQNDIQASTILAEALSQVQKQPDSYAKGLQLFGLGQLSVEIQEQFPQIQKQRSLRAIYDIFNDSLKLAEYYQDKRLIADAKGFQGKLYHLVGRDKEALRLTREATFLAPPTSRWKLEFQQGNILQKQNDLESALKAYQQGLSI